MEEIEVDIDEYIEIILSIIDYNFIRRTDKCLENATDAEIENLFITQKDDIIVSDKHAQLVTQNDYFDYEFYKSNYSELVNMSPSNVLDHYLIYGKYNDYVVSKSHAQKLTKNPDFDIYLYKLYYEDLQHMNPKQLVNHYNAFGKKEGRNFN